MANELNTTQKATIDDDTSHALPSGQYACTSSDVTVATTGTIGGYWYCIAQGPGSATVHAVRLADNFTGDVEVTVTEVEAPEPPGTFAIQLGALSAK